MRGEMKMLGKASEMLRRVDPSIAAIIDSEMKRERDGIELIASENVVSPAMLAAAGSVLTNKYAEGYPGKRYYGGCEVVDQAEDLARERAKKLFGCDHVNVQPHSGSQANMAVYFFVLKPGDTILAMDLSHGGHLTHGSPVGRPLNKSHDRRKHRSPDNCVLCIPSHWALASCTAMPPAHCMC